MPSCLKCKCFAWDHNSNNGGHVCYCEKYKVHLTKKHADVGGFAVDCSHFEKIQPTKKITNIPIEWDKTEITEKDLERYGISLVFCPDSKKLIYKPIGEVK